MKQGMHITIIGTGNVATVLGRTIKDAGHTIVQVYGRDAAKAKQLAAILQAEALCPGLDSNQHASAGTDVQQQTGGQQQTGVQQSINPSADIYIIAVADAAIPAVAAQLQLSGKLVVHTAGSVSKEVLSACSDRYGILYPLQSLRREMQQEPVIPLLVDAANAEDLSLLQDFALTLSRQVQVAGDEERLKLHVAAVIVSNFTNHLYALAEQYCIAEKADFRLLLPLIAEVATRLQYLSPGQAQTGPAIRKDTPTIEKHLELLKHHGALQDIYKIMTESITSL
jgi:predicted short-subunit dehydrogenase-like oxidoreductase (DUF2520 family)